MNRTHGLSQTKTYRCWANMIQRCTNSNNNRYADWGGRGITVCKRWLKFENFIHDMGVIPHGHTLDRRNNARGYSLQNCRWSTAKRQAENRRRKCLARNNTSGTVGVSWSSHRHKWRAYRYYGAKQKHLGWFETKREAQRALKPKHPSKCSHCGERYHKKPKLANDGYIPEWLCLGGK